MQTLPIVLTAFLAFGITAALGKPMIPYLKRLKFGQTIKEIGPLWHKTKEGTPTMGGLCFIAGTIAAAAVGFFLLQGTAPGPETTQTLHAIRFWAGIVMALAFGFIGFIDDYIKVVKKRNLGLKARQKVVMQVLVSALYLLTLYLAGDRSVSVTIPFLGSLDLWWFYYPLMVIYMIYFVNAVNLTDGIDGLCTSVTFVVAVGMMVVASLLNFMEISVLSTALAGAMIGFLLYNIHPARMFMGDTGSMFLGGMVLAILFGIGLPVFSVLCGIVYILEALSVVLQVASFKLTHKRIFKMSPIHHHFEMSGWSENKIVVVFSAVALAGVALTVFAIMQL